MSKQFDVNTGNLKQITNDYQKICRSLENYSQAMQNISSQMSAYSYGNVRNSLSKVIQENNNNIRRMRKMENSLTSIALKYEQTEKQIVNHSSIVGGPGSGLLFERISIEELFPERIKNLGPDGKLEIPESIWKIDIEDWLGFIPIMPLVPISPVIPGIIGLHKLFEIKEGRPEGSVSYKDWESKNEVLSGAFLTAEGEADLEKWHAYAQGSAAILTGAIKKEGKYAAGSAEASLFKVEGETSIGVSGSYSEKDEEGDVSTIGAKISGSATVLSGEAEGHLGLEDMNVHGEAEGALLGAGAEAEGGITYGTNGEFTAKAGAEAEAYLAKGEVKGGFTIFGIDIEVGAEGMIGVQAEAEVEAGLDGFGFDLGLGPIGVDIAIDWSDFDLTFWD